MTTSTTGRTLSKGLLGMKFMNKGTSSIIANALQGETTWTTDSDTPTIKTVSSYLAFMSKEPSIAPRSFNKTEQEDEEKERMAEDIADAIGGGGVEKKGGGISGETKRKRRRSDEDVDEKEGRKKQKGHPRLPPQETIDLTGE
jgi:hypothetical protein